MKKLLLVLSIAFSTVVNAQNFSWAKSMGSSLADQGNSIALDSTGNVYTVGFFQGTADFDPGVGVSNLTSNGYYDIFITKFDNSGNLVWVKQIGGTDLDQAMSIKLDNYGNIYLAGSFTLTVDFDPNTGIQNYTSGGNWGAFILKLTPSGDFVWVKTFSGIGGVIVNSLDIDDFGNIYTAGYFHFNVDFDPSVNVFNLSTAAGSDGFITKLDSTGNFIWAKGFISASGGGSGTYYNEAKSLSVDDFGNVYTTGVFQGTVDFNTDVTNVLNLTSSNGGTSKDLFISKLDSAGNFKWAGKIGSSTGDDIGRSIKTDALGNSYVGGVFTGIVDFNPNAGVSNVSGVGNKDAFILKLDSTCNFKWAKCIGGINIETCNSIFVDGNSNIYATGMFQGTVDFDPGIGMNNITAVGGIDVFVTKLDSSGVYNWSASMGGASLDEGVDVVADASGFVYSTGRYAIAIDADFDPGIGVFNLTAVGSSDIFVSKLSPYAVGVTANTLVPSTSIYPNPTNGLFTLQLKNENDCTISIVDVTGKEVYALKNVKSDKINLNISQLNKGIYFVKVLADNEQEVLKLIKE